MTIQLSLIKKRILLFVYLSFVFSIILFRTFAAGASEKNNVLDNVVAKETEEFFEVTLKFDRPFDGNQVEVDYGNELLMIDVVGADSKVDKRKTNINGAFVKSMYSYVPTEGVTRHNIRYQNNSPIDLKGLIEVVKEDNNLTFRIKHPTTKTAYADISVLNRESESIEIKEAHKLLPQPPLMLQVNNEVVQTEEKSLAAASGTTSVAQPSLLNEIGARDPASTELTANDAENLTQAKSSIASAATADGLESEKNLEKNTPVYKNKNEKNIQQAEEPMSPIRKIVLTVLLIVISGGAIIWQLKKRSQSINKPSSLMQIKVLTQHHLGPKKSLMVVRVAGESMLLGVSESGISLIKTLSLLDEEYTEEVNNPPKKFKDSLMDKVNSEEDSSPKKIDSKVAAIKRTDEASLNIEEDHATGLLNLESMVQEKLKNLRPL